MCDLFKDMLSRSKMFYWLPILVLFGSLCWSPAVSRVIQKRAAFYIANETMCIVDGDVYRNGDPVPTDDECERCTCRPPGFSCVLRDCDTKPGCKAVRKAGECCPEYVCGCVHNNRLYEDGELIKDLQNNCYTCRCHGSSISCTFADCRFRGDCPPEYVAGECCPRYDHCPPLSTTTTTTEPTTMFIVQQEVEFVNMTTQHLEKFITEDTTLTVVDVQTTPTYDLISVTFTLSGEKISSIHDYDTTELTTILPVQTVKYKETTKHIMPPPDTELTTLKDGLVVDDFDKTTTKHLSQSTSGLEILPAISTTSEIPSTQDHAFTTVETFESGGEIRTTSHDSSTADSDSTTAKDIGTEFPQTVHLTSDSGEVPKITQQQSTHSEAGYDITSSTEIYSIKETDHKPGVIHEDQTTSTQYFSTSTVGPFDLESSTVGLTDTTKRDEITHHSDIVKSSESTHDDLHASSGEIQTVTDVLLPESSQSTELDSDDLYIVSNQTDFVQESASDETKSATTVEGYTSDSEHEIDQETETAESDQETHKTASYYELPTSTFMHQTVTISGQKSESSTYSTHGETDDSDIVTKSTDSRITFDTSGTSDSSETIPEITSHHHEGETEFASTDLDSAETFTTENASEVQSTSISHLDVSKFEGPAVTTSSSLETTSKIDVSTLITENVTFSDHDIETTTSQHIHSFEELDSSEDDLNITFHDYKSTSRDTFQPIDKIHTPEKADSFDESIITSTDAYIISHKQDATETDVTSKETTLNATDNDITSFSPSNLSLDSSKVTTADTISISEFTEISVFHSNDSAVSQSSSESTSETKQKTEYVSSTAEVTDGLSHQDIESSKDVTATEIYKSSASTVTDLNAKSSSEDQEADAESQEVTSETQTPETTTVKTTEIDEILYTKDSEINTKTLDEIETTPKPVTDQDVEFLVTLTEGSEIKPSTITEERLKITHTEDLTSLVDGVDSEFDISASEELTSFPDVDTKRNVTFTTIHALTQEAEISTHQTEVPSAVGKTSASTQVPLHYETGSHIETFTEKPSTEYDSTPTFISDLQLTTEAKKSGVIVETAHDTKLSATHGTSTTQFPEPAEITSLKPHTEKLPITSESDLPSELPAFEPPLANILKQQMLFNQPTTEKSSSSVRPDDIQNLQTNLTTDENHIVKLALTLEETGENITSLMSNESESEILVLNHEYTIPDSEIISFELFNSSEKEYHPKDSVELENTNLVQNTVKDQITTASSIGTSSFIEEDASKPTNIYENDDLASFISNTDMMESEHLYNETADKEASDVNSEASKGTNLLSDELEEHSLSTEQDLPHSNHDVFESLADNLSQENSTDESQMNALGHELGGINGNFEFLTTANNNDSSTEKVTSSDTQTEYEPLRGDEKHEASENTVPTEAYDDKIQVAPVSEMITKISTDETLNEKLTTTSDLPRTSESDLPTTSESDLPTTSGSDLPTTSESDLPATSESDLPTISESDLPSELPAFEPPLANILKQQILFNKPTTESENSSENLENVDYLLEDHNETNIEYQDAENTVGSHVEKEIPTTNSVDELHPELITIDKDISNQDVVITKDYDTASTEPEDIKAEQSTTVKINVLFGQDSLDPLHEYQQPSHHSSEASNEDNLNENFSSSNKEIAVNSEIKVIHTDEQTNEFSESEKSKQSYENSNKISLGQSTEFPASTQDVNENRDSETDSDLHNEKHDLTNNSEKQFDNSVFDHPVRFILSNLPYVNISHNSSSSENKSVPEEPISTAEDSSSPFTILEYLGDLFSGVSTFSTVPDVNENITENSLEFSNSSLSDVLLTTNKSSLSNRSNQTYSSFLKDKYAEYGSLGGVFITGESKYNKSSFNENDQKDTLSNNAFTEDTGSINNDNDYEIIHSSGQDNLVPEMEIEEHLYTEVSELNSKGFTENSEEAITDDYEKENQDFRKKDESSNSYASEQTSTAEVSSEIGKEQETTVLDTAKVTSEEESLPQSTTSMNTRVHSDSENTDDSLFSLIEIKEESGPEKGGEWFEPKDPDLTLAIPANEQNLSNTTTLPNKGEEDPDTTIETGVDHGPEKGGEVFEPSFPEIFPINNENSAVKNEKTPENQNIDSTEITTQETTLRENTTFSVIHTNETKDMSETNADSELNLEFVPPLPILLKEFNNHIQRNNDTDYAYKTVNSDDVSKEESATTSSKGLSGRSFKHPFHMSDIISRVFKAPGYDSEINLDRVDRFGPLKKSQILRLKRDADWLSEVKGELNTQIANSNSYSSPNKNLANNPSQDAYPINDKNILLVEGYGYKPSGFFPITSSFIIIESDEDSDDNETEVDPKRKTGEAQTEVGISEAGLLDKISSGISNVHKSHPTK